MSGVLLSGAQRRCSQSDVGGRDRTSPAGLGSFVFGLTSWGLTEAASRLTSSRLIDPMVEDLAAFPRAAGTMGKPADAPWSHGWAT